MRFSTSITFSIYAGSNHFPTDDSPRISLSSLHVAGRRLGTKLMQALKQTCEMLIGVLFVASLCAAASAQYISADTYTRYELLVPETHQFKIYYEVTETRVGARFHFNQI